MAWQRHHQDFHTKRPTQERDQTTIASTRITEEERALREQKSQRLRELRLGAPIKMPAPIKAQRMK